MKTEKYSKWAVDKKIEILLAIISFSLMSVIYFVFLPEAYKSASASAHIYRPAIYLVFAVLIPLFLFGLRNYADNYGFKTRNLGKSILFGLLIGIPVFMIGYKFPLGAQPPLVIFLINAALEEIYFRGLLQRAFQSLAGVSGAIIFPAILFGIYHITLGFGFVPVLGVIMFGVLLGKLRQGTDNIASPIILHWALLIGMWFSHL